ncbi:MAG: NADPH-dependent glutamate synthase [Proteobacteria bacterium]|nr:NADPH-dependent glutamate synthase [Pseudomonadota bacterium]
MKMSRTVMPVRDPHERSGDFGEVNLGFDDDDAMLEASRCLECARPVCVEGCPVNIRIADFIVAVAAGEFATAASIISEDNLLPAVCGRVCPQETQCEQACVLAKRGRPIAIGHLERYVADRDRESGARPSVGAMPGSGSKVAIVGSGPAGLACAGDLIRKGHNVTVFEALHELGGVLAYGIPSFRLPRSIVRAEIDALARRGVVFETDVLVGSGVSIEELMTREGFGAVFIGTGAGLPRFPGIAGDDLIGVYSANELLTRVNLMHANHADSQTPIVDMDHQPVVVVGGGNTAVDAARTARRLGGDPVTILYRRSALEMPARLEEVEHAREEGVDIRYLTEPTSFNGIDGWLSSVGVHSMQLTALDDDGRAWPEPIPGSESIVPASVAIVAIGNAPNPILLRATPGLIVRDRGTVDTNSESGATSIRGVFAGGDVATGGATVILALAAGRRAARAIDEFLDPTAGGDASLVGC